MKILAIESSCDETSAAVVEKDRKDIHLISQSTATSLSLHSKTGGIIPEVAAREQSIYMIPVLQETLEKAGLTFDRQTSPAIDAIAVTYGPGLIGSLLVGVETAKTLSFIWDKPLIPVNHLFGHIYANWIDNTPQFPLIALIVSGGHTDLLFMKSHTEITWLGGTRDDAAGECFDKAGRLLGFAYPAGPAIEKHALLGDPKAYHFPRPLLYDGAYDFSFSGLKTAILRAVQKQEHLTQETVNNICRGLQDAIIDVLVTKTLHAAKEHQVKSVLLSGGVAANTTLTQAFLQKSEGFSLHVPPKSLCTDNGAMIGAAALYRFEETSWKDLAANPELYFD